MESGLKLQGLVGLYDPPRTETLGAVKKCHDAGIAVHMLTGDHLSTATAIAQKVGILNPSLQTSQTVMRAQDFDKLSDAEIDLMPSLPAVLARCSPTTKVRMVDALSRRQAFCVMTGDGVNDAPALKRAHVGIAMGINGTDVAKDAADMVLTDDNFASIVKAVEEGRRLFDNIQKFLMHLLISNIAQVILLLIALAFKDGAGNSVFPLSPLEILWVNMITSSFLALGLGMEEAQADIMVRSPRDLRVGVFTWELICDKMLYGSWAGILCLLSFVTVVYGWGDGNLGTDCNEEWNETCDVVFRGRATVFAVLSFLLLVTAWEVKHFSRSLFNLDPARFPGRFSVFKALTYNRFLLWAVVAGFLITFPVIYIPVVNKTVFKHMAIGWEWGIVFSALVAYIAFVETWKAIKRRFGIWSGKGQTLNATEVA
jgi:potassium/sodium efflux P-type ATPase